MNHQHDPYAPPQAALDESEPKPQIPQNAIQGIGGWLLLPVIGLVVTVLRSSRELIDFFRTFEPENVSEFISVDSSLYHPLWLPVFITEIIIFAFIIIFPIYLLWQVFEKKKRVRKLFIFLYLFVLLLQFLDLTFLTLISLQYTEMDKADNVTQFGRSVWQSLIWVPYFLFSKRVKNTFIN